MVVRKIIRSHIINPLTGYPAHNSHHMVNITSDTLSGLTLDYLTTALTVLSVQDGLTFLSEEYPSDDINVIYSGYFNDEWFVGLYKRLSRRENTIISVSERIPRNKSRILTIKVAFLNNIY